MILFIFEGKREKDIYSAIENVFLANNGKNQCIVSCFDNNIYELYKYFKDDDYDIVSLMKERCCNSKDNPFTDDMKSSDFAEVFLFFDYDFHHNMNILTTKELNEQVEHMLSVFNDETRNGKLYISYPMLEAIRYTKRLPDDNYITYKITRSECKCFKDKSSEFSIYKNFDFITALSKGVDIVKRNWQLLIKQNLRKAHWLCVGQLCDYNLCCSHTQEEIFKAQGEYVEKDYVSILSAYPLFLYDYFGPKIVE